MSQTRLLALSALVIFSVGCSNGGSSGGGGAPAAAPNDPARPAAPKEGEAPAKPAPKKADDGVTVAELKGATMVLRKDLKYQLYLRDGRELSYSEANDLDRSWTESYCHLFIAQDAPSGASFPVQKLEETQVHMPSRSTGGLRIILGQREAISVPFLKLTSTLGELRKACFGTAVDFYLAAPETGGTPAPGPAVPPSVPPAQPPEPVVEIPWEKVVYSISPYESKEILGLLPATAQENVKAESDLACTRDTENQEFECRASFNRRAYKFTRFTSNQIATKLLKQSDDRLNAEGRLSMVCSRTALPVCRVIEVVNPARVASKPAPVRPPVEPPPAKKSLFASPLRPAGQTHPPYPETIEIAGYDKMMAVVRTAAFAVLVPKENSFVRGTEKIPVLQITNEGAPLAKLEVEDHTRKDFYGQHKIQSGALLKDGSLILVGYDGSNRNGAYRAGFILKVDASLKPSESFGQHGLVLLKETNTKFNYRFIESVQEQPDGGLLALERRRVREGEPDYGSTPDQCFRFKLNGVSGRPDTRFGKNGVESVKCP